MYGLYDFLKSCWSFFWEVLKTNVHPLASTAPTPQLQLHHRPASPSGLFKVNLGMVLECRQEGNEYLFGDHVLSYPEIGILQRKNSLRVITWTLRLGVFGLRFWVLRASQNRLEYIRKYETSRPPFSLNTIFPFPEPVFRNTLNFTQKI